MKTFRRVAALAAIQLLAAPVAFAQLAGPPVIPPGGGGADLPDVAGKIINAFLSVLGIIAVVIIIIGGFKWLTSGGSDEKVEEAKKMLMSGIIGVIIILAAFAIARFVVGSVYTAVQ